MMQPITSNTLVQDLGSLEEIDVENMAAVLWGRFGVVGELRAHDGAYAIDVEDLDRKLGEAPGFRLELHILALAASPSRNERLRAALIPSRRHQRVDAYCSTPKYLVLFCEPGRGASLSELAEPDLGELYALGADLAEFVEKMHEAEMSGVDFRRGSVEAEGGFYYLRGFGHLLGEHSERGEDLTSIVALLRATGGEGLVSLPTAPEHAGDLSRLLRSSDDPKPLVDTNEPPFVGRRAALGALEDGVRQAKIAQPTVVVVEGERGIGKSRLLREFAARYLRSDEVLVLTGAWHSSSGGTGSGILSALEQLPRILPRFGPDERDDIRRRINRATKHLGAVVARSAPKLGAVLRHAEELPELELGGDFSRHTVVIADVLKSLGTRQRPLVLVLDNIEGVDSNSAAILDIISQVRPAHYTLVVMGLRTGVQGYRPKFDHAGVALEPLTQDDVREMLEQSLPGEIQEPEKITQALHSASLGVPLNLGATLRAWIDDGRISRTSDGVWHARKSLAAEATSEPNVRDLFGFRFSGATPATQRFGLDIAVFGSELDREYLDELSGGDAVVDDLCRQGILVRTNAGVRFPHDTIRELVLDSFSESQRREAHRGAADILTRHNAPIPEVVYHLDLGIDVDTATPEDFDKLSRHHVEAGRDRLDVYDLERARWHLERALDHSHDVEQRAIAAEGLADICLLQEDLDTAVSLYTALIATTDASSAVRVAAKATQFLYGKNATSDARQIGNMALEMADEPTPSSTIGRLWVLFSSLVRPLFGTCTLDPVLRDGLCRLYNYMLYSSLIDDPIAVPMFAARGRWVAIGLETSPAAVMRSLEAGLATVLGFFKHANEVFAISTRIAHESKDAWAQGMVFHHWGGALLALDRYSEGQDRLDDGIAAFRETGDVSMSLISMYYKCSYARDREHADTVLGWIDETLATARRHGKKSAVLTAKALQLHMFARQGRTDIDERLQAVGVESDEAYGMERLASHIELAYAHLELSNIEQAYIHVKAAQADAESMGDTVPEFCQEVHFVAALVMLERPHQTRVERKALRTAIREFRKSIKNAPRLVVLNNVLELKLAQIEGLSDRAQQFASKIVSEFDSHENLYAARIAHKAIARLMVGANVLAAAEHEKLARNFGRRLGLGDRVLLDDFTDMGDEVALFDLTDESMNVLEESQHDIPAAGMLTAAVQNSAATRTAKKSDPLALDMGLDVLEAWALTDTGTSQVSLGTLMEEAREAAVQASVSRDIVHTFCSDPEAEVPFTRGDLQLLVVNMVHAVRDASPGTLVKVEIGLNLADVTDPRELRELRLGGAGSYLTVEVMGQGSRSQTPVIGAFATCEKFVRALGGVLSATTSPGSVTLQAHLEMAEPASQKAATASVGRVVVIHPDQTIRETLGAALQELSIDFDTYDSSGFQYSAVDRAEVIFSDGETLQNLHLLQPFSSARLVEIVRRGAMATDHDSEVLRYPFAVSDLKDYFGG